MKRLQLFSENVWVVEGPTVSFFTFPYPTRMVVIRIADGSAWLWSPVEISEKLAQEIEESVGPVRYLVSPNKLHWLFMKGWKDRYPEAKMYASPGLAQRSAAKGLMFDATLTNDADPSYACEIDQFIFQGGYLDEVVFFHKPSKTVLFCDLIQRFPEEDMKGWKGWIMKKDGMVGFSGGAPGEVRFLFWITGHLPNARRYVDKIIYEWQPEKLIIAHGMNADKSASAVVSASFGWVPQQPRECCSCLSRNALKEE